MPTDIFHGSDCELRFGVMPDASTLPVLWHKAEFVSLTVTPSRDRKDRPKLGAPRTNTLDPVKGIDGFERLSLDLVIDGDSRAAAILLRHVLGAPVTTALVDDEEAPTGLYSHVWKSGIAAPQFCAFQLRTAANKVRVYRGITMAALATSATGEQIQDFDLQFSLRGVAKSSAPDWLAGAAKAIPAAAPASRAIYLVDGVPVERTLQVSWSYDRGIVEDIFLSPTATVSAVRPGTSSLTGSAQFRAVGAEFDDMEENGEVFASTLRLLGSVPDHLIDLSHPRAMLNAPPLAIPGPDQIERTFAWTAHQDETSPAAELTIVTDLAALDLVG